MKYKWIKKMNSLLYVPERLANEDGYIYLAHRRKAFVNSSWANWDEITEAGWRDSANNFICLFENINAGGNEVGQGGGLSEANRTLTQVGNVNGATGSPPTRALDHNDDYFTCLTAVPSLLTGAEWTYIIKLKDLPNYGGLSSDILFYFADSGAVNWAIYCRLKVPNTVYVAWGGVNHTTAKQPSTSGDLWFAMWRGSGYETRAGYCEGGSGENGQPIQWSDFALGNSDRLEMGASGSPAAGVFTALNAIGYSGTNQRCGGDIYYVIASNKCLIDNSA